MDLAKVMEMVFNNELPNGVSVGRSIDLEDKTIYYHYRSAHIHVGHGDNNHKRFIYWATAYRAYSDKNNKDDVSHLLCLLRDYYENAKFDFALSFADTTLLRNIVYVHKIPVREDKYIDCFDMNLLGAAWLLGK